MNARAASWGGGLAVLTLPLHFLLPHQLSVVVAAVMLAAIGAIYLGFALSDGRRRIMAIEGLVGVGFIVGAVIGFSVNPWLIIIGYGLHGLWDGAHHRHVDTVMPRWYIPFCAIYDLIFASGLAIIWSLG